MNIEPSKLSRRFARAVAAYWSTRRRQSAKQGSTSTREVGPSFGNNFNNRTEEAMGSALDLWTASREGAFNKTIRPWLGYVFLLEDCEASRLPVKVKEPHFKVFPEFVNASYAKRYELFCRKLVRERHHNASAFLLSEPKTGKKGAFVECVHAPAAEEDALALHEKSTPIASAGHLARK